MGQDYYQTYARTRVECISSTFFLPPNTGKLAEYGQAWHFFLFCAKARLRETLVIIPFDKAPFQDKRSWQQPRTEPSEFRVASNCSCHSWTIDSPCESPACNCCVTLTAVQKTLVKTPCLDLLWEMALTSGGDFLGVKIKARKVSKVRGEFRAATLQKCGVIILSVFL